MYSLLLLLCIYIYISIYICISLCVLSLLFLFMLSFFLIHLSVKPNCTVVAGGGLDDFAAKNQIFFPEPLRLQWGY